MPATASNRGTILKVGGPKVYPVFWPTAHNAQLLYKLTGIFVILALATANAECR